MVGRAEFAGFGEKTSKEGKRVVGEMIPRQVRQGHGGTGQSVSGGERLEKHGHVKGRRSPNKES